MATQTDIELRRGDSKNYRVVITDTTTPTPAPIDITGAVVRFTVKRRPTDPQSSALIVLATYDPAEILLSDPVNGECLVQIPSGPTNGQRAGEYCWDLEVSRPGAVISSSGTVALSAGSGVMVFSDPAVVAVASAGNVLDLSGAANAQNQRVVAITETPDTPGSELAANELRTDYDGFVDEAAAPFTLQASDVKTPDKLFGIFTLLPDVTS